ncbi:MAG: sulfite exporter TauE/SafE family protein, partial [Bacteroidota bacterium]
AILLLFAVIMIFAAVSMIRSRTNPAVDRKPSPKGMAVMMLEGLVVGVLTGIVGAGGGFLIVPSLVLLVGMPMKRAVGTSLCIISLKSLIGFTGDLGTDQVIDWYFLAGFTSLAIVGIFLGIYLTRYFSGENLKKGFGILILLMGLVILGTTLKDIVVLS